MARPYKQPAAASRFGDWLRGERSARGWTLDQLAARAGSAASVISNLERGLRHPSRAMAQRLAGALEAADPAPALLAAGFAPHPEIAASDSAQNPVPVQSRAQSPSGRTAAAAYNNAPPEIQRAYDELERAQLRLLDPFVDKSRRETAAARRADRLRRQTESFDALLTAAADSDSDSEGEPQPEIHVQ